VGFVDEVGEGGGREKRLDGVRILSVCFCASRDLFR
jgi:hypothetical protein